MNVNNDALQQGKPDQTLAENIGQKKAVHVLESESLY